MKNNFSRELGLVVGIAALCVAYFQAMSWLGPLGFWLVTAIALVGLITLGIVVFRRNDHAWRRSEFDLSAKHPPVASPPGPPKRGSIERGRLRENDLPRD